MAPPFVGSLCREKREGGGTDTHGSVRICRWAARPIATPRREVDHGGMLRVVLETWVAALLVLSALALWAAFALEPERLDRD
jgi:hypothetical protein